MAIRRLSKASITSGAKSSKMWDQETSLGYYESIATAVAGADNDYVDFTNIPQNYTHLQLRVTGASSYTSGGTQSYINMWVGLNTPVGTTGTSGYTHIMYGDGANAWATAYSQTGLLNTGWFPYGYSASFVGTQIIDILDYTSNKNKVIRSIHGFDVNGSGIVGMHSGNTNLTSPVISIRFNGNAGGVKANNIVSLYGIRGA
jgi:hypothetical protein